MSMRIYVMGTNGLEQRDVSLADHTHSMATSTQPGYMSAQDKARLDALSTGGAALEPLTNEELEAMLQ